MEIQIIKTRRKTVSLEVKRYCPDYKVYRNQLKKYETV